VSADGSAGAHRSVAKPDELLALHDVTGEMFATLGRWFAVPSSVALDLSDVDAAVAQLGDPVMIAALAMRKLQALRLLAQPGVRTTTDVVVAIVTDLDRALIQAPAMRLKLQAAATDWDEELAGLAEAPSSTAADPSPSVPASADEDDPEAERFKELHRRLHTAMFAVIQASDGEICQFT
jgi:hypothetical protein